MRRIDEADDDVTDAAGTRLKDRTKERRSADPLLVDAGVLEGYNRV